MKNKSFSKLNETFNIEDSEDIIEETIIEKNKIKETIKDQKYTLENSEYLKTELQDLISTNRMVLNELANSCKVGAPPRLFEVYATLSNTISTNIMDLAKIEQVITDYQVTENKENIKKEEIKQREKAVVAKINAKQAPNKLTQINNTYTFDSKTLLKSVLDKKLEANNNVINNIEDLPTFDLD